MKWSFDFRPGKMFAYSHGAKYGGYVVDMWTGWFESRVDGDSIDKYKTLEDAIQGCEDYDKNYEKITGDK